MEEIHQENNVVVEILIVSHYKVTRVSFPQRFQTHYDV